MTARLADHKIGVNISLLKRAEIGAAAKLLCAQLEEHGLGNNSRQVRSVIGRIAGDKRHGFILRAKAGKEIVGVALACAYLGVEHGGASGWLEELYVRPACRQKGIGTKLVAAVIRGAKSRGWRALDLEVTSDHQRVVSLYARHGFVPHARSRFYLKLK